MWYLLRLVLPDGYIILRGATDVKHYFKSFLKMLFGCAVQWIKPLPGGPGEGTL
jgi:hypothetical protein